MKNNPKYRYLLMYFGIHQGLHALTNMRAGYVLLYQNRIAYPALSGIYGWPEGIKTAFISMATLDTINSIFSILWVLHAFKTKKIAVWVGIIALTITTYSDLLFDIITFSAGGWVGLNILSYVITNISFIPFIILFIKLIRSKLNQPLD